MKPPMRWTCVLLVTSLAVAGCDKRAEEPLLSPPPRTPASDVSHAAPATPRAPAAAATSAIATAVASVAAPARCMVPTPDAPPPAVEPARSCPSDPLPGGFDLTKTTISFVDAPGQPQLDVELAQLDIERERGLMYRTSMPESAGMLFVFDRPTVHTFWMHNTCIPLDMMFVADDGFITGILENVPTLNDASRSIPCPASYVLEVNAGWSRKHGVRAGQRIKLPPQGT